MQKNLLNWLLMFCFIAAYTQLLAQTDRSQFYLRVASASGGQDLYRTTNQEDCGYGTADFGGSVTKDFSGELVWVYDNVGNDSLSCDTITKNYTGKVALIRRGVCEFGVKAYRAFKAGAIAVIIVNDNRTTNTDCTCINIGGGTSGLADRITIPVVFASRSLANAIDRKFKARETVTASFILLRMHTANAAFAYATPITQNDTLFNNSVHFVNITSAAQTNVVVKVDVIAPDKTVQTISKTLATVPAGKDTLVSLPIKPKDLLGVHTAIFSNSVYKERRDTLRRQFRLTPYTYAVDNFKIEKGQGGAGPDDATFADAGLRYQVGTLYLTGDKPAVVTHTTFGLANAKDVYDPTPGSEAANDIKIALYDADRNNDNVLDLANSFDDLRNPVASATYRITGKELPDTLFSVKLTPTTGTKIELKRNHAYYLIYSYDGSLGSTGVSVAYSYSIEGPYDNDYLITPIQLGDDLYTGWSGNVAIVQRLELEGFKPTVGVKDAPQLDAAKYAVTPNPASDMVRVTVNLNERQSLVLQLFDQTGRLVRSENQQNFQSGQLTFATRDLPAGLYTLRVRAEKEGVAAQTISIVR